MEQTYEEEEEDEFMKEDFQSWDIFRDAHKFARREQILEKRKKKEVEEELNAIRSDRLHHEGQSEREEFKEKLERMHEKLLKKDKVIDKCKAREQELIEEKNKFEEKLAMKDNEIQQF